MHVGWIVDRNDDGRMVADGCGDVDRLLGTRNLPDSANAERPVAQLRFYEQQWWSDSEEEEEEEEDFNWK